MIHSRLIVFSILFILLIRNISIGQRVGINAISVDSSAVLEIKSDSFGILIPRLDSQSMVNISNPAKSLLLFQKDGNEGFKYFDGTAWKSLLKENVQIIYIHPDSLHKDSISAFIERLSLPVESFFHYDTITAPQQVWFWDGSQALRVWDDSAVGIKTLPNYASLRSLDHYPHDIVNVADWTYTGPDGNTYTTLGGIFKRIPVGQENGGTIIVSSNNVVWERNWDKIHVVPEWWECGGYDRDGFNYTDKNVSDHGIYSDSDRISAALKCGDVLELFNRTYIIDKTIHVPDGKVVNGNNATLKRFDVGNVTLTAAISSPLTNSGTIKISDTKNFRVGSQIVVTDNSAEYGGLLLNNSVAQQFSQAVTGITDDNLFLNNTGWNGTYDIGDNVYIRLTLLNVQGGAIIRNLNFDGNAAHYPVHDWNIQYCIANDQSTLSKPLIISNISIKNSTGESIGISAGHISNVYCENTTGSVVHIGGAGISNDQMGGTITNLFAKNVTTSFQFTNDIYPQLINHNEGVITISVDAKNWFIENINVDGAISLIGPLDDNNSEIFVNKASCKNMHYIVYDMFNATSNFQLSNSIFKNCGMFYADNANNLKLTNNTFVNSTFVLGGRNIEFTNNYVISENNDEWAGFNFALYGARSTAYYNQKALIRINGTEADIKIHNNTFRGLSVLDEDQYTHGLLFGIDPSGNNTENNGFELSFANVSVKGNKILNFKRGISFSRNYGEQYYKSYMGIVITENIIKMNNAVSVGSWGMQVPPGAEVYNNTIYGQTNTGEPNSCMMAVSGIASNSVNTLTSPGAHVFNNTFYKPVGNNIYCIWVGPGQDDYNNIVHDNNLPINVTDSSNGNSSIFSNRIIINLSRNVGDF